jgi:aminoglycoside 6'-N-acetyltransferase
LDDFDFRRLARSDFVLLGRWLAQPHVARWWDADPSLDAMEADHGGCIDGTEPAEVFIALHKGEPFGFVQRFRLDSYPQYLAELAPVLPVPAAAFSIDYLVGPPEALGRGWGSAMIAAFVRELWRDHPQACALIVPVHADNIASWHALERAGFARAATGLLTPDNPADNRNHYVYRLDRP